MGHRKKNQSKTQTKWRVKRMATEPIKDSWKAPSEPVVKILVEADELIEKGHEQNDKKFLLEAEKVILAGIKKYPNADQLYAELGDYYYFDIYPEEEYPV